MLTTINVIKIADKILSIVGKGPEKWGNLNTKVSIALKVENKEYNTAFSYLLGQRLIDYNENTDIVSLTPDGVEASRIGIEEYEKTRKDILINIPKYYTETRKHYRTSRIIMIITVIVAILSIAANLYIALYY